MSHATKNTHIVGKHIKIADKIGEGGYGCIQKCLDENGNEMAVKILEIEDDGIAHPIEMCIMSLLDSEYLTKALHIHVEDRKVNILMELAISDLSKWTKVDKKANRVSTDELKRWSFCIIQAVACLHNENIIHGDIKAANVLLYKDSVVRLADFSLAVKKWTEGATYHHGTGTATHRAPEVTLKREWDEKIDIWSLGCTLYEVAYGEHLFPYQGGRDISKTEAYRRGLECQIDWSLKHTSHIFDDEDK